MNPIDIIELSENEDDCVVDSIIIKNHIDTIYKKICNDNPVLTEFIETCFASLRSLSQSTAEHWKKELESPAAMKRVINTIFLKIYTKTDKKFRESKKFKKALRRSMNLIKSDFRHKFSHIKDLCEILKTGKIKKRLPLITLSNKLKDNEISCQKLPKKIEIIDLDEHTENDLTIDLDSYETGDKENDTCLNKIVNGNELLVPHKSLEVKELSSDDENTIIRIEEEIVQLQKKIAELDEQEVFDDNMNSPYIQSEYYKARIVTLYKELCKLTGVETVKRSRVHLKVLEGHPSGPVRRLETFLNSNVGSDVHPPFPNFRDVFTCVENANKEDSLGWSKQQIMVEAISLFTHCGRALQRRRQRREWRDLLSKVKVQRDPADDDLADDDPMDDDPADNDPSLLARLEDNRRRAQRQETEILDRYAMLQNTLSQKKSTVPNRAKGAHKSSNESEIDSSCDEGSTKDEQNVNLPSQIATSSRNNTGMDGTEDSSEVTVVKIKEEYQSCVGRILEEFGDNYTTSIIIDIDDSLVDIVISDSSDEDSN